MNDDITPEALEAAGWSDYGNRKGRYWLNAGGITGAELTIWRVGEQGPLEITVYCDGDHQNVRIGYALTMSEVNAIAAVAKRTV